MCFPPDKLLKNDPETWLQLIWHALSCYREDCIPEGQEAHYDEQWNDICRAMAWIRDALGPSGEIEAGGEK